MSMRGIWCLPCGPFLSCLSLLGLISFSIALPSANDAVKPIVPRDIAISIAIALMIFIFFKKWNLDIYTSHKLKTALQI